MAEAIEQAVIRVSGAKGLLAVLQAVKPASNKQVQRDLYPLAKSRNQGQGHLLTARPCTTGECGHYHKRRHIAAVGGRIKKPAELHLPQLRGRLTPLRQV